LTILQDDPNTEQT
jgi:NADH dehydrogenase [ubiquinone] 1 alpha subcomplex assembly factor 6